MLQKMQKKIEEFHMISPGDTVIAGVSGGADSVCLLLCLDRLQKELDFQLEVIHVEHGIRGEESLKDKEFVENLCKQLHISYEVSHVNVPEYAIKHGLGMEEAARILRYEVFRQIASKKNGKIALAHHKEDNAETVLFQMVRGSSLPGLCGMQPVRQDREGVCYIRPLLFFHREEIEEFLNSKKIRWCNDSTNTQLDYSRNFLRAQVIPELTKINAQAVEHINQSAENLSQIKEYLDIETERLWEKVAKVGKEVTIFLDPFLSLHIVMQRQIVYKAITCVAKQKKDITSAHVDAVMMLSKAQSGKRISLPYGIVVWKEFEELHFAYAKEDCMPNEAIEKVYDVTPEILASLIEVEETITIHLGEERERIECRVFQNNPKDVEIPRKTYTKWFDYDKIKKGFCIRTRRSGDYLISDTLGRHKKLKEYFINEKIPLLERDKIWILANKSEVLWVIGGRISEHIKVTNDTKYIFEITYDGGKGHE